MKFPAGTYYVGDLCYVLDDMWDEYCDLLDEGDDGVYTLSNGVKFASFNTLYGDGTYSDQYARKYPVDSGGIGLIAVKDLSAYTDFSGGHVITFDADFGVGCHRDTGEIYFGSIFIDTDTSNYETDEW